MAAARGWAGGILLLALGACAPADRLHTLTGQTMGTTYAIRIAHTRLSAARLTALHQEIEAVLAEVNRQMSTYRADSEISRFNRAQSTGPMAVSADFAHVVRQALIVADATDGAFDPTVGALVNLWGFGPEGAVARRPAPDQIEAARQRTGHRHVTVTEEGRLAKARPDLHLDLGAIAKGFGVDRVADLLREQGLRHFLVEIGGETLAEGFNADGVPWRVGVLRPHIASAELQGVLHLTGGRAVATSGDYRNYFRDEDGALRSHLIDPRTAAPVAHATASVTVVAGDCLTADALATALMVLGHEEGLPVLERAFPGVEVLFIVRRDDGGFEEIATPGFGEALRYEATEEKAETLKR